jgi:hypothetical protein
MAELFNLYETWLRPVELAQEVFRTAACGSHTDLILLTPAIDTSGRRHLPFFRQWRSQITAFTLDRLQADIPREGFFAKATPTCYLPRAPTYTHAPRPPNSSSSYHPSSASTAVSVITTATDRTASSRQSRFPQRQQNPRPPSDSTTQGESRQTDRQSEPGALARVPIITSATGQGFLKPLRVLLDSINQNRSPAHKVYPPMCLLTGTPRATPLCFRFSAQGANGCPDISTCRYAHIDLGDRTWVQRNVPPQFFDNLLIFLNRNEVKQFYQPTPELLSFLGRR